MTVRHVMMWCACLLLVAGCTNQPVQPLSDSLFVEVLTDLHLADAQRQLLDLPEGPVRDSILKVRGVSEDRLQATLNHYAANPDSYLAIYDRVISRLNEVAQERRAASNEARSSDE